MYSVYMHVSGIPQPIINTLICTSIKLACTYLKLQNKANMRW